MGSLLVGMSGYLIELASMGMDKIDSGVIKKEVVITTLAKRGSGRPMDPVRNITQVWDADGGLIAENNPVKPPRFSQMLTFASWCRFQNLTDSDITMDVLQEWFATGDKPED